MATFNQQNQQVTYQYNAETINFAEVHNKNDFLVSLERLQHELEKAKAAKLIDEKDISDAEQKLSEAAIEAKKPIPNKGHIIDYLKSAGTLLKSATALGGLALALQKAAELAENLF